MICMEYIPCSGDPIISYMDGFRLRAKSFTSTFVKTTSFFLQKKLKIKENGWELTFSQLHMGTVHFNLCNNDLSFLPE